jgi:hypothetical protein
MVQGYALTPPKGKIKKICRIPRIIEMVGTEPDWIFTG